MQYQTPTRRPLSNWLVGLSLLIASTSLSGCGAVLNTLQDVVGQTPTASVTNVRLSNLDLRSATLEFEIAVANPYTFDLPLLDFDFGLSTNAQPFMNGSTKVDGSVPAGGSKTLKMPVRVDLVGLVETVRGIRPGQVVPYDAELGLSVDLAGSGPMRLPLRKSGELPVPNVPSVEVSSFQWDQLSLSKVTGNLFLEIGNTNEFPFTLSSLDYDLSIADAQVADGRLSESLELAPGKAGALTIPVSFSPARAGTALFNVLRGSELDYDILGSVALNTPFGALTLPYERSGTATKR